MKPLRTTLVVLLAALGGAGAYVYAYGWPEGVQSFGLAGNEEPDEEKAEPPTQVVFADVGQADIAITVEAIGDTAARESVVVTSRVSGRVREIAFTDGQDVETGDILVTLDPADALDQVRVAEAAAEEARQAYRRAAQLASDGTGPRAVANDLLRQAEAAEAEVGSARERLDDYNIRAPFAGRLGLRNVSLGALIQPGGEIATLDTIDPIEIRFTVPERYLGAVEKGARVEARTPAFPDGAFAGEVTAIATRVDPALRTVTLEASIPNDDERLLPGMLMNVTVELGLREDAVVAPPIAVQLEGSTHFVFRARDGKAERVEVEIGQRDAAGIEIVEGLEAGERVIVEGFQDLTAGQEVAEAQPRDGEAGQAEAAAPATEPQG